MLDENIWCTLIWKQNTNELICYQISEWRSRVFRTAERALALEGVWAMTVPLRVARNAFPELNERIG